MKSTLKFLILMVLLCACSAEKQTVKTENKNCFSPKNFSQLKEYIQTRIKYSGMGKFYVEYPPDKTEPADTIKRPSKHPENVYDVTYDETLNQITFESKTAEYNFLSDNGLLYKKDHTKKDHQTANNIFCYLTSMSDTN